MAAPTAAAPSERRPGARDSDRAPLRGWHAAIFATALCVRLAYLYEMRASVHFAVPVGDGSAFDAWARDLAAGSWLGSGVFYQAPLYPYVLGLVYAAVGRDLMAARLVQAVLGAAACCLLADAGRRFFDRATGRLAGFALALYAPAIFFDGLIKKVALATLLTALFLALVARCLDRPRAGAALAAGAALGALALTRENALVLLPLVVVWFLAAFPTERPRVRFACAGACAAGVLAVLAPAGVRNLVAGGELVLGATNFGTNLYIGNNPRADGFYRPLRPGRGHPEFERADATELAEAAEGRRLSATEVSDHWRDEALRWIVAEPAAAARLYLRKLAWLFHAHEWMDVQSYDLVRRESRVLTVLGSVFRYGVLVPLAAAGMALAWPWRRRLVLLYGGFALLAAGIAAFFVFARFRMGLVPFLVPFAVWTPLAAARRWRAGARRELVAPLAGALVLAFLVHDPLRWLGSVRIEEAAVATTYNNLGTALEREGRDEEALALFRRAVEARGDHAPARFNLAQALVARGRLEEALPHFDEALRLEPSYAPDVQAAVGLARARAGDLAAAAELLQRARAAAPGSADLAADLGLVLRQLGRLEEAEACYRDALRLRPDFADAHNNLGFLLDGLGRETEAAEHYEAALRAEPRHRAALESLAWLRASDPRADLRDGRAAERWARRGLELAPGDPRWLDALAAALAEQGRFAEAVGVGERALAVAPPDLVPELQARVALYRAGRPYRYGPPEGG